MFYPVYLNLAGKRVLVVGGGEVAERKIESLLGTGASIDVVSPVATSRILVLASEKRIRLHRRPYETDDCKDANCVFSATDDPAVSHAVFRDAHAAGALVNT